MEQGLFPLARAEEQPDGLEEERRLCYVGLTRAKDKLYLSWARARRRGGELRPGHSLAVSARPATGHHRGAPHHLALGAGLGRRAAGDPTRDSGWRGSRAESGYSSVRRRPRSADQTPPEEVSQDSPRYVKGERVRHRRFGSGTIQGLTGVGRDLKVSVAFDDAEVGVKQLLVAYAGLEREMESA